MDPEALLFDLDGTLVDGAAAIHDAFEHALRETGMPPVPRAQVAGMIGAPLRLMFRELCQASDADAALLVRAYRARFETEAPRLVRPTPGAREALERYHGVPMAVVTTKAVEPARTVLRALGFERHFAVVVGVDTVMRPKPDPEGVRIALSRLAVAAPRAAFVGDTVMDVVAGRGAGARTIAVANGHGDPGELAAAQPDAIIPDLTRLHEALMQL
ncbi:MAG: pyrophosphatase PpaX [Thermoplasmata archaeon]|nr:pyrophosphatase PpaX [Thermoplasmata archaeon]